ncbi:Nif3-like dinuclear metal center hexameric protein [Halostella sp. JP-L12]|uniref:Nif3-like dinuclear metal center hexameric protein n=1 Tax=Halostella TaxID=1843185 RepID=UPI000EF829F0|nr:MULTISPECIES: Nif3-like dinuclear metal center hexameric protein [Halostella]NHN47127.1 Nif3-like dinuclear metal center hexameric protein [Halostella sp. JP-L12]
MDLSEFRDRFDERLRVDDYADVDAAANGLQVGPEEATVERAVFAVDAAVETIEEAIDAGGDVLVTHHGVSWGGFDRVTGRKYDRIAPLIEEDLALYAVHLPLDGHVELGNAAGVADLLDLTDRERFGAVGPEYIGLRGRASESFTAETLRERLGDALDTGGRDVQVLDFGPKTIEDVAVVTGSGTDWIDEAESKGVDALVTGEGKQKAYHQAREAGITVALAGHYATETFGVRALRDVAEEWGLETAYVDRPTGL